MGILLPNIGRKITDVFQPDIKIYNTMKTKSMPPFAASVLIIFKNAKTGFARTQSRQKAQRDYSCSAETTDLDQNT